MADKIKVMGYSDSLTVPTGYGRVCREIFSRLSPKKFDYVHWGKQSIGQPHLTNFFMEFGEKPIGEIFAEAKAGNIVNSVEEFEQWFDSHFVRQIPMHNSPDGSDIFDAHFQREKPDIYFQLLDLWMANWVLEKDFTPAKSVIYYPADGYPLPEGCFRHLLKADVPVAMSKFTKKLSEETEFVDESSGRKVLVSDRLMRPIEYIPHGVSTNVFRPLDPKGLEMERVQANVANKFVFGMVGRNQPRKSHERLFKAFAKFQKGKPDVVLWLHCDPVDMQGFNLYNMAHRYGVRPIFTKMQSFKWGLSDAQLNMVYNLFDCHVLSSTGEGFGLPILEAASAGLPQILVDYTSSRELMGLEADTSFPDIYQEGGLKNIHTDMGILTPPVTLIDGSMNVERALPDINQLVNAMQYVYDNKNEAKQMGRRARSFAMQYDWGLIVKQWEELFVGTVNGKN